MTQEFEDRKRENFLAYLESSADLDDLDFDLYARDPQDFPELNNSLTNFHMISAGGMCPFQAEGYMNDYYFYLRSRHGRTRLNVSQNKDDVYLEPLWTSYVEGETDFHNLTTRFLMLTRTLKKANFCFYFEGHPWMREDGALKADLTKKDSYPSRGMNAEEAYQNLFAPDEYLLEKLKLNMDEYVSLRKDQKFNKTPENSDTREFPDNMPIFLK